MPKFTHLAVAMFASLPVAVIFLLSWPLGVVTSNDCQPITWANPPEARADHTKTLVVPTIAWLPDKPIKAGDINCRSYDRTYDDANYYSCKELAYKWNIRLAWFFQINPTLLPDCSNILPNTLYCIRACKFVMSGTCNSSPLPTPQLASLCPQ